MILNYVHYHPAFRAPPFIAGLHTAELADDLLQLVVGFVT